MAQPVVREAAAQEQPRIDARTLETIRTQVTERLAAIRQGWQALQRDGFPADRLVVAENDENVRRLLETLATNAQGLNIPITGTTPQERFRSLNNWLNTSWRGRSGLTGRNQDSPINEAALREFQERMQVALSRPGALAVADAVVPAVPATGGQTAQQQPPVVAPQPTVTAPALTAERRAEYERMVTDLNVLVDYGANDRQKRRARELRDGIRGILDNQTPTQRQIDQAERNFGRPARELLYTRGNPSTALAQAQRRATAPPAQAQPSARTQAEPATFASVTALIERLQRIAQDQTKPETTRQIANGLASELSNIWRLGERERRVEDGGNVTNPGTGPRWEMFSLLDQAATALEAGNESQATAKRTQATQLFEREQQLMARRVEIALAAADRFTGRNPSQHLGSRSTLRTAGSLETVPARGGMPATDNSAEGIESLIQRRVADFRRYQQANPGRLSNDFVSDFYHFTTLYAATGSRLMDIYDYYIANRPSDAAAARRADATFYRELGRAQRTLVDPEYDPTSSWPAELRRILRQEYGAATGNASVTDRDVAAALRRAPEWRYDTALFAVYQVAVQRAPALPQDVQSAGEAWGRLRGARIFYDRQYTRYQTGELSSAQHRYDEAKFFLQQLVTGYAVTEGTTTRSVPALITQLGLPATVTDRMVAMVNGQLRARGSPTTDEQRREYADLFFNLAIDVSALLEGELLYRTSGLRASSVGADSATLRSSRTILDEARAELERGYGTADARVSGPLYPLLPRHIEDSVIRMLAPGALSTTETHSWFRVRTEIENSAPNVDALQAQQPLDRIPNPEHDANPRAPATIEVRRPIPEDAYWPVWLQDRQSSLDAAMNAEISHIRMLVSLRGNADFGVTATDRALAQTPGLPASVRLLEPRANSSPEDALSATWRRTLTFDRADQAAGRVQEGGRARTRLHERAELFPLGHAYVEFYRQRILSRDENWPLLLRGMDSAPNAYGQAQLDDTLQRAGRVQDAALRRRLEENARALYTSPEFGLRGKVQRIARGLGLPLDQPFLTSVRNKMYQIASDPSLDASARQRELNRLLIGVLDVRIAELETRLERGRRLTDGVLISDLANRDDPRGAYVIRAQQGLASARRLRTALAENPARDLFGSRVDPRQAIMIAENAIASLRDENIDMIPVPPVREPNFVAYVAQSDLDVERLGGEPRRVRFTARQVMVREDGRETTLQQYERAGTPAHGPQNLTYFWFIYQDLGRTDSSGEPIHYLLNPDYRESGQERYIGQVMRNVTIVDGSRRITGDFVVRVRRTGLQPSTGPEWEPIVERDGTVRASNVLYQVRGGTLEPVRDARLESAMTHGEGRLHVCRERASAADTVVEYGPTTPVLIIRPSATRRTER
ncbi:MAG: hypothetical protein AB1324_05080 [Candidatus Micrarchaeota archaeon]